MVLGDNKRSPYNAYRKPKEQKAFMAMTQSNKHNRKSPSDQQAGIGDPGTNPVHQPADKKPRQYSRRHGGNYQIPNLGLRERQFLPYNGHQRCNPKPAKKT